MNASMKDVSLSIESIDAEIIDHLRERYQLRSLSLSRDIYGQQLEYSVGAELYGAINRLLMRCRYTLKALRLEAPGDEISLANSLELPPGLRVFSLGQTQTNTAPLSDVTIQRLTEGELCSLRLWKFSIIPEPTRSFGYLHAFTRLTHLNIQLAPGNVGSLTAALEHLPLLRAVELDAEHENTFPHINTVVEALGSSCRNLEHLRLFRWLSPKTMGSIPAMLFSRLDRLVSLELRNVGMDSTSWSWDWLEELAERGRLEHLVIATKDGPYMPIELICRVIGKCKVPLLFLFLTTEE